MRPGHDVLPLRAQLFDAQRHDVAGRQEPGLWLLPHAHAGGRAGADDVAGLKGQELAEVGDQSGYPEDHRAGAAVLDAPPADLQPDGQIVRVADLVRGDQPGPYRPEGVAALALVPGAAAVQLEVTFGHVMDDAVAGHVIQSLRLADI